MSIVGPTHAFAAQLIRLGCGACLGPQCKRSISLCPAQILCGSAEYPALISRPPAFGCGFAALGKHGTRSGNLLRLKVGNNGARLSYSVE